MRIYKDKDVNYINSLHKTKKREEELKRIISAFMACHIFLGVGFVNDMAKYSVSHANPFNGNHISSSDFINNYKLLKVRDFMYDESFKESIEAIKNSNIDEKKAYLLYYAILSNQSLMEEEKEEFKGYIQYFVDNKYLDYEYVYEKLDSLYIKPINKDLNSAGSYNLKGNFISFDTIDARKIALTHETFHAEDKSGELLLYGDYAWFIEGLTSVLNYEYFNKKDDGYDEKSAFIRIMCQFVGADVLFETRAKGDINILISALVNKGLLKEEIQRMFYLINEYNFAENKYSLETSYIISELYKKLFESYNIINENPDFVDPLFYDFLCDIDNPYILPETDTTKNIYFFNTSKIKQNIIPNSIREKKTIIYNPDKQIDCQVKQKVVTEYYKDREIRTIYNDDVFVSSVCKMIPKEQIEEQIDRDEKNLLSIKNYT